MGRGMGSASFFALRSLFMGLWRKRRKEAQVMNEGEGIAAS